MRLYVAAPWVHREQAKNAAVFLEDAGHHVQARWLYQHEDTTDPIRLRQEALHDEQEVHDCEAFILLNLCKSDGKATELGMAHVLKKPIIVVGGADGNVFYYLPNIHHAASLEEVLTLLH